MALSTPGPEYLRAAETFLLRCTASTGTDGNPLLFDGYSLKGLYDPEAKPGFISCRMKVGNNHRNFMGNLHGGCTATLVDVVGSAALCTVSSKPHVSLSITTNYLRAAPVGSTIRVEASVSCVFVLALACVLEHDKNAHFLSFALMPSWLQVIKPGASVTTVEVRIFDDANDKLVAQGTHVKVRR